MGNANQVQTRKPCPLSASSPEIDNPRQFRDVVGPVDHEQWHSIHSDVPSIRESPQEPVKMSGMVIPSGIRLLYEQGVGALPTGVPAVIRPTQTEREVGLTGMNDFVYRALQDPSRTKPVMVKTKSFDAVALRQICLSLASLWQAQIIKSQVCR
jgi:hypothetical protein